MPNSLADTVRALCTSNLKLKLLSVTVALCIWSFASISRETRYELALPVELRNIPTGYSLGSQPPREIRFTLAGPSILMDGVRRSNASLILNMRGAGTGKTLFSHLEKNLKLPEEIKVTRVSPETMVIELNRENHNLTEGDQKQ